MIAGKLVKRKLEPFDGALNVKLFPSEILLIVQGLEELSRARIRRAGEIATPSDSNFYSLEKLVEQSGRLFVAARQATELRELFLDDEQRR